MLPNNGILLNDTLSPKLLYNPLASCSFKSLALLLPDTAHIDRRIIPKCFV